MTDGINQVVKLVLAQAAGTCSGCGQPVFANIHHSCGGPYRLGGPEGEIVVVGTIAPASSEAAGFAPQVGVTQNRTSCEACGGELKADVMHICAGNAHVVDQAQRDQQAAP